MIFTLLYYSQLLKNNKYRNIYLYVVGVILYAIIHFALFSSFGEALPMVKKYRRGIYAVAACDMAYAKYLLKSAQKTHTKHNAENKEEGPIIEELQEMSHENNKERKPEKSNEHQRKQISGHKQRLTCEEGICKRENISEHSMHSIPVYKSTHKTEQLPTTEQVNRHVEEPIEQPNEQEIEQEIKQEIKQEIEQDNEQDEEQDEEQENEQVTEKQNTVNVPDSKNDVQQNQQSVD